MVKFWLTVWVTQASVWLSNELFGINNVERGNGETSAYYVMMIVKVLHS